MTNSEKRSILCPNCRRLISDYEPRCPYCNTAKPGSWWRNNRLTRKVFSPDIIRTIITVNIVMYVFSLLLNPWSSASSLNPFQFLSPSNNSLLILGATGTYPIDHFHRWWTLISANYLHGGIIHIFFNMFAFKQLAPFVLQKYGTSRMIILYTLSGVAGFYVSYLAGIPFTIGASASVCGLIGCALYYGKSRGGAYGDAIYRQIGGWAVGLIIFGFVVPGINNWGHAGGMAAGALLGLLLGYGERKRENIVHKSFALICIVITLLILAYSAFLSIIFTLL